MRLVAVVVAAAVALGMPEVAASAGSAKLTDPEQHYTVTVPDAWTAVEVEDNDEGRLAAYTAAGDAVAAITRVTFPNIDARRAATKKAFFARVEKGVEDASTGYERLYSKQTSAGSVPLLDITYRHERADGSKEVVFLRFIFHRTYSVSLAIAIADDAYKANKKAHEQLIKSFKPYFGK